MSSIHVLYFAACRERAGVGSDDVAVAAGATVDDVVRAIVALRPSLSAVAKQCRVAVNQAFARSTDVVPDGAEVALIPPVAGG